MAKERTAERTAPHSHDAEQATLGAMLIDHGEAVGAAVEMIPTRAFYSPAHRKIFDAIIDVSERDEGVDITTVAEELEKRGDLADCGGRTYLSDLASGVATAANIEYYCNIVREKWQLRETIAIATNIIDDCYRATEPAEVVVERAEGRIFELASGRSTDDFTPLREIVPGVLLSIEELHQSEGGLLGVSTGFRELDDLTAGLQRGDLIILAGRPSMGKSALALNISENVGRSDRQGVVAFFSLEMTKHNLALRSVCGQARVNSRAAQRGKYTVDEGDQLAGAMPRVQALNIEIDSTSLLKPMGMRRKLRRLVKILHGEGKHLSLVVVDYLQLMDADKERDNRTQDLSVITRRLKAMAKEFDVPFLVLSQLSRAVESRGGDHRPQLSDLRDSGAIEQDADVVMFVFRKEYYLRDLPKDHEDRAEWNGKAEIIIAKQRNGPTDSLWLQFSKTIVKFENLAPGWRPPPVGGRKRTASINENF